MRLWITFTEIPPQLSTNYMIVTQVSVDNFLKLHTEPNPSVAKNSVGIGWSSGGDMTCGFGHEKSASVSYGCAFAAVELLAG